MTLVIVGRNMSGIIPCIFHTLLLCASKFGLSGFVLEAGKINQIQWRGSKVAPHLGVPSLSVESLAEMGALIG